MTIMLYYIDQIKRQYPYTLMGMNRKESYEFFRDKLLEHYMPGLNGQHVSDSKLIEAVGDVFYEMNTIHNDYNDRMNPDFEMHLYAEWLKRNRQQYWNSNIDGLARTLGNGIYDWCRTHPREGLILSPELIAIIGQLPWQYN